MNISTAELLKNIIYYGLAFALLIGGWVSFGGAWSAENAFVTVGGVILGCGLLLGAAILLAFPIARLASVPWGNLLYPDAKYDRPQPLYSLAEAQARREEYEKAMGTFEQISVDFPGEIRPWVGMVEIAVMALKDVARADRIYQSGIEQLEAQEARDSFARMYRGIRSRLNEEPEWGKKRTIDLIPSPRTRRGSRRNFR